MCEFYSCIVTKTGNVLDSEMSDSHEHIIKENNLKDDKIINRTWCRIEITPPNFKFDAPLNEWNYRIDEPENIDWHTEKHKKAVLIALKKQLENNCLINKTVEEINNQKIKIMYNSTISEMYGNSTISLMFGNSTISQMYGNSTISEMYGNSTISKMYDNSIISQMYDNSTISEMYYNSTISQMYGNSTISKMYDNSTISKMYDNSTISEMCGNSTVRYLLSENCFVRTYNNKIENHKKGLIMDLTKKRKIIDKPGDK